MLRAQHLPANRQRLFVIRSSRSLVPLLPQKIAQVEKRMGRVRMLRPIDLLTSGQDLLVVGPRGRVVALSLQQQGNDTAARPSYEKSEEQTSELQSPR